MIAALKTPYGPAAKSISLPDTLPIVTIEAAALRSRYGIAALTRLTVPIMSTSKLARQFAASSGMARALTLATTMSRPPSSAALSATHRCMPASSATSTTSPAAVLPPVTRARSPCSPRSTFRLLGHHDDHDISLRVAGHARIYRPSGCACAARCLRLAGVAAMLKTLRSVLRFRPVHLRAADRRLSTVASVADYRRLARRRLPRGVFDYVDGGAEDELSLRRNSGAFRRLEFRPRVLCDVGKLDTSTTLLGRRIPVPVILAPTGFTRIASPGGEMDVARAAARAGLPYTLSTLATRSIEQVASVSGGPKWFQVYVWRDRGLVKDLLARAAAAGYEAIVITVDTAVLGRRERDVRHGLTLPPKIGLRTLIDGALHPGWTWDFVRAEPITFANVTGMTVADGSSAVTLADYINGQFDPSLSWRDLDWFRAEWDGPIVLKGVQTVDDARIAANAGIEGIALSNHGGRQLDGAPVPLELVSEVADVVGDRAEVICDGGVRRGSDIVKAMALGASACMVGRAYLYGLAAVGERGVDGVLKLLAADMERTMALIGCRSVAELGTDLVRWRPPSLV